MLINFNYSVIGTHWNAPFFWFFESRWGSSHVSRSGLNDTQKPFWVFFCLQLQMISYERYLLLQLEIKPLMHVTEQGVIIILIGKDIVAFCGHHLGVTQQVADIPRRHP